MCDWKTPDDYKGEELNYHCNYEIRQDVRCTQKFLDLGFLKNSRWDIYAEYKTLCKNCPHFTEDVGIYFGNGHYTDNFQNKDTIWCVGKISDQSELIQLVSNIPQTVKAIFIDDIRTDNLFALEKFESLECVVIGYCPKLTHFWDFSHTPHFKVLEYMASPRLTDISEIGTAESLEYFGINTSISKESLNYIDSFYPLTKLKNLKELSLNATMCSDNNIDNLINIPYLRKLWISPHTFSTEDFAKFEVLKFKIYDEYGIYQNGKDYVRPLGKGARSFRSEESKDKFKKIYLEKMLKYKEH